VVGLLFQYDFPRVVEKVSKSDIKKVYVKDDGRLPI